MNPLIKCHGVSVVLSIGHFEIVQGTGRVSNLNQSVIWHHMKAHLDVDHLTRFGAFMLNRDIGMDPQTSLKIHTNVSNFYDFGGCCQEIRDICKDSEPCLKVPTSISIQGKSIKLMSQMIHLNVMLSCGDARLSIAVIAIAPMRKALCVYSYVQTRLMGQCNGKWPISLLYVLKPLITAIRAVAENLKLIAAPCATSKWAIFLNCPNTLNCVQK